MVGAWPIFLHQPEHYVWWPFATRRKLSMGDVVIRSGTRVYAADGWVGRAAGFVVDDRRGELKQVIVREGHFWNQKEVIVPTAQVEVLCETEIRLALDLRSIKALPPMSAHHGVKA